MKTHTPRLDGALAAVLDRIDKAAGNKPPKGFTPLPGSTMGGHGKTVGNKVMAWYPGGKQHTYNAKTYGTDPGTGHPLSVDMDHRTGGGHGHMFSIESTAPHEEKATGAKWKARHIDTAKHATPHHTEVGSYGDWHHAKTIGEAHDWIHSRVPSGGNP